MSKTGKAVLIFTSITALMGIAMYIIYKQSIKSTSSTANSTNAYMKSLANVFSGISSAIGNPSSDIPASAWAGGSNRPIIILQLVLKLVILLILVLIILIQE